MLCIILEILGSWFKWANAASTFIALRKNSAAIRSKEIILPEEKINNVTSTKWHVVYYSRKANNSFNSFTKLIINFIENQGDVRNSFKLKINSLELGKHKRRITQPGDYTSHCEVLSMAIGQYVISC